MVGWGINAGEQDGGDGPSLRDVMGAIQKLSVQISAHEDFSQRRRKTEYPEFDGSFTPNDYLDWVSQMENLFQFNDVSERRRVKIAASKLTNSAAKWWDKICRVRDCEYKKKVQDWDKMKRIMAKRFISEKETKKNCIKLGQSHEESSEAFTLISVPLAFTSNNESLIVEELKVLNVCEVSNMNATICAVDITIKDKLEHDFSSHSYKVPNLLLDICPTDPLPKEAHAVKAHASESLLTPVQFIGAFKETGGQTKQLMANVYTVPTSCASEGVLKSNNTNEGTYGFSRYPSSVSLLLRAFLDVELNRQMQPLIDKGLLCCKSMRPRDVLFDWLIMVSTKLKIHDIKNLWSSSSSLGEYDAGALSTSS